jgi:hypothetical protein
MAAPGPALNWPSEPPMIGPRRAEVDPERPRRVATGVSAAEHEGSVVAHHENQNFPKKVNPHRQIGPAQRAGGIGGPRPLDG